MTTIEIEPVDFYCPECDSMLDATGCPAVNCQGYRCVNCQYGCDLFAVTSDCFRAAQARGYFGRRQQLEWLAGRPDWLYRGGECL